MSHAIALPEPRVAGGGEIAVREAVTDDLPFIDSLQKQHTKMVGFFPRMWFENNIKAGKVLIAEEHEPRRHGGTETAAIDGGKSPAQN